MLHNRYCLGARAEKRRGDTKEVERNEQKGEKDSE